MKKKRIKVALLQLFELLQPGDQIQSEEIVKSVKRRLGIKYIYADSVLRYLRELRKQGKVSYKCTCKSKRIFEVL